MNRFHSEYMALVAQDVENWKPDLVIFFTGPKYEGELMQQLSPLHPNKIQISKEVDSEFIAKIDCAYKNGLVIRCPHPDPRSWKNRESNLNTLYNYIIRQLP